MPPSIAEGPEGTPWPTPAVRNPVSWLVGLGLVLVAFVLYWVSNPEHYNFYNHFVWQADAFLHGRAWFPYPVLAGGDLPDELVPAGRVPAHAPGRDARRACPAALPAAAGDRAAAVRGGLGAGDGPGGDRDRPRGPRRRAGLVDARRAAAAHVRPGADDGRLRHRHRLVVGDGRRAAPGTSPTSWPPTSRSSPWAIALRQDPDGRGRAPRDEARPGGRSIRPAIRRLGLAAAIAVAPRPLAGPRRVPARPRGHRPAAADLRGAVLHPGRRRRDARRGAWPRPRWAGSCPWWSCSATRTSRRARSCTRATTTSTGSRPRAIPTLGYNPAWSVEDPRYVPQNLGIMLGALPEVLPDVLPNTLGIVEDVPLCTDPGSAALPVRRRLPARGPGRHRDQHPPLRPGAAPGAVRVPPARADPPGHRRPPSRSC